MRKLPVYTKPKLDDKTILVIEDDAGLSLVLKKKLTSLGMDVKVVQSGEEGTYELSTKSWNLALVDLGLPDMNGMEVMSVVREKGIKTPLIVITGNVDRQRERGSYLSGANIFHPKPVDFELLEAQIFSLIGLSAGDEQIQYGHAVLDSSTSSLKVLDHMTELSYKELELLRLLFSNPGKIFSRDQVIRHTFRGVYEPQPGSVDTLVSRLRKKIDAEDSDRVIETVHGLGFRINRRLNATGK
jgi:DNA-binding response OmpR family regulator